MGTPAPRHVIGTTYPGQNSMPELRMGQVLILKVMDSSTSNYFCSVIHMYTYTLFYINVYMLALPARSCSSASVRHVAAVDAYTTTDHPINGRPERGHERYRARTPMDAGT